MRYPDNFDPDSSVNYSHSYCSGKFKHYGLHTNSNIINPVDSELRLLKLFWLELSQQKFWRDWPPRLHQSRHQNSWIFKIRLQAMHQEFYQLRFAFQLRYREDIVLNLNSAIRCCDDFGPDSNSSTRSTRESDLFCNSSIRCPFGSQVDSNSGFYHILAIFTNVLPCS